MEVTNEIINKNRNSFNTFPDKLIKNGVDICDKMDIADNFNKFFVKVGPTLANNLPKEKN